MKLGRCPTCHGHLDLVSMMEDDAGRDLLALLTKLPPKVVRALLPYLTLFRAPTRDLSLSRTLTLAEEVLSITSDKDTLAVAMLETVESIRNKGAAKSFKSHGYLKTVISALHEKHGHQGDGSTHVPTSSNSIRAAGNEDAYRQQMRDLGFELGTNGQLVKREDA